MGKIGDIVKTFYISGSQLWKMEQIVEKGIFSIHQGNGVHFFK